MSIESNEGIDQIQAALRELSETYHTIAKLEGRPPTEEPEYMAFPLTRGEARQVLDRRVEKLKAELKQLGFNKPVVQVGLGERDAAA